jgi:hypothetical protein
VACRLQAALQREAQLLPQQVAQLCLLLRMALLHVLTCLQWLHTLQQPAARALTALQPSAR